MKQAGINSQEIRMEKNMKKRTLVVAVMVFMLSTGGAWAQMGGRGLMGPGMMGGWGNGYNAGTDLDHTGNGMGYGIAGSGGIGSMMYGNTLSYGYLYNLHPITTDAEARTAIQAFLNTSNSNLQIYEIWEYGAVYKAELIDTNQAHAFDIMADKFTGAVMPEMGLSMMMNASYGMHLYRTPVLERTLSVSEAQATQIAQDFVNSNNLGYTLGTPEIYPGYYKFHTTQGAGLGMDIMVNGYNGAIWMNTLFGLPLNKF